MRVFFLAVVLVVTACSPGPMPAPSSPTGSASSQTVCVQPNDPDSHVYHSYRLKVIQQCITVTGTIDFERPERDGDYHIGLRVDPQFADLPNDCNATCLNGAEHGDLVLEPVCELSVTQADAVSACAGYHNPIVIPPVGSHVKVTGPYVLDQDHGWTEIHPVVALEVA